MTHIQSPTATLLANPVSNYEQEARQRAYSQERHQYMAAFEPHPADDSPAKDQAARSLNVATKKRTRQRREDPRQLSFFEMEGV